MNEITPAPKRSLVDSMASKYHMEPAAFVGAIKASVIKGNCSNEQFAAFLMVAKEYDLNPLTKEIYAFPDRGGITPIVSIDGWMNLINSHPSFNGMIFEDHEIDGKITSITCRMYRKDRDHPIEVKEYLDECIRPTEPWKKWPARMLRHKAAIQAARYAFGFSGIMEPDEYDRMADVSPEQKPLSERLSEKRRAETTDTGFDANSVQEQLDNATEPQEDVIDAEAEQPVEEATENAPEQEEELTDGQFELLEDIKASFAGCRDIQALEADVAKFKPEVEAGGPALINAAIKLYEEKKASFGGAS